MAQVRAEVGMTLRRGESLLLTVLIPVVLLAFFSLADVLPTPDGTRRAVDFLAPGILALAVMSTAMTGLAIATGFERSYSVLKRLGTTPLGRGRLVVAKVLSVLVVEGVQLALLLPLSLALGWSPDVGGIGAVAAGVLLGTAAFGGLGLLMAGTLPALTTLAAANGLYVVLLLFGDMVIPLDRLPSAVESAARLLPAAALAEVLRSGFAGTTAVGALVVLAAWAVVAPAAAAATFRWE